MYRGAAFAAACYGTREMFEKLEWRVYEYLDG
jgi:hypothetical protein